MKEAYGYFRLWSRGESTAGGPGDSMPSLQQPDLPSDGSDDDKMLAGETFTQGTHWP